MSLEPANPYAPPKGRGALIAGPRGGAGPEFRFPTLAAVALGALAWRGLPYLGSFFPLRFPTVPSLVICAVLLAAVASLVAMKFCRGSLAVQAALVIAGALFWPVLDMHSIPRALYLLRALVGPVFISFSATVIAIFALRAIARRTRWAS